MSKQEAQETIPNAVGLREMIDAALPFPPGPTRPWAEQKLAARRNATRGKFDLERMLCNGRPEALIAGCVSDAIRVLESYRQGAEHDFLQMLAIEFADSLSLGFRNDEDITINDDAIVFALSVLYLFPALWNALNKPLPLDRIKALDFRSLLLKRRSAR